VNNVEKEPFFNNVYGKLVLYIAAASLTSLGNDLGHYTCHDVGWQDITPVHWATIVINLLVQGLIAWRAFIDGSADILNEETKTKPQKSNLQGVHEEPSKQKKGTRPYTKVKREGKEKSSTPGK
jgi:hypothetical protein